MALRPLQAQALQAGRGPRITRAHSARGAAWRANCRFRRPGTKRGRSFRARRQTDHDRRTRADRPAGSGRRDHRSSASRGELPILPPCNSSSGLLPVLMRFVGQLSLIRLALGPSTTRRGGHRPWSAPVSDRLSARSSSWLWRSRSSPSGDHRSRAGVGSRRRLRCRVSRAAGGLLILILALGVLAMSIRFTLMSPVGSAGIGRADRRSSSAAGG